MERRGPRWRFRLYDLGIGLRPVTAWITVPDPEKLRRSPHAKLLRETLKRRHPETWERILENVIGVAQDEADQWPVLELKAEVGTPALGTGPDPGSGDVVGASEEAKKAEKAELRRRAEELLRDPHLLYLVGQEMGYTIMGEENTRILMWLLHLTSQVSDDYAFQRITGESAVGKTKLTQGTLRYVPKKWWRKVGRISKTALEYLKDQDFQLLWIQEAAGGAEAAPSIRLSSADDGGLEAWVTERDPETGRFTTRKTRLPGRSVITTTTEVAINPQDATRTWLISADASPEQTGRIIDYKLSRAAEPPELLKALGRAPKDLAPIIREAVSILDYRAPVVVAYADELRALLSNQVVRARRDVDKMLGLIRIVARVHQHQRPVVQVGNPRFIYATAADAFMAFDLGGKPLEETLTGLERRLMAVYKAVEKLGVATNKTVAAELRKGYDYALRSLRVLVNMGYVDIDESHKTHTYTVRADMPVNVSRERLRTLRASTLQEKVKSALSAMSAQQPLGGAVIHVKSITPETGYFSPTTGEWRDWEAETRVPVHPPADELLSEHQEPGAETLQEQMDAVWAIGARLQRENNGLPVRCLDLYDAVERELGLDNREIQRILDILIRDGRVFHPTPYALYFKGWEVET